MLEVVIERAWPKATYTIGRFFARGIRLFESLEDTDRGLRDDMSISEIRRKKIAGKTAIPKGTYKLVLSYSPKFKDKIWAKKYNGLVPQIMNVKCYSGVRIHPGTTEKDTDGCPLVGKNTKVGKLTDSVHCYYQLMDEYLIPAHNNKEDMWITIK